MYPSRRPSHDRRARLRPAALVAALVAMSTSGCSLLPFGADDGRSTQTLADGSAFLVDTPTNVGDEALISGRLAVISDNCIGLDYPSTGESAALTFPHGTRVSDDGNAIALPDGLSIALGDDIYGAGGSNTLGQGPDPLRLWPDAPSGCGTATYLTAIYDVSLGQPPQG